MEMGASSASSPADDGEIWAPILSDPIKWRPSSAHLHPIQMEDGLYSRCEDGAMKNQNLIEETQDEQYLGEWLEGAFSPSAYLWETNLTYQMEHEIYSPTWDDGTTIQALKEPEKNLLDTIPKGGWRCAPRGPRKRRTSPLNPPYFGNMPFASGGRRYGGRKNNDHWTHEEVIKLVEGVAKYGVGRWTQVKTHYFSTSVRKAVHLKDKWRNLLRAYGVKCTSQMKKESKKTMLRPLSATLIKRIQGLAAEHLLSKTN